MNALRRLVAWLRRPAGREGELVRQRLVHQATIARGNRALAEYRRLETAARRHP